MRLKSHFFHKAAPLSLPRDLLALMKRIKAIHDGLPATVVIQAQTLRIADALLCLNQALHALPPLPAGEQGEPRLMHLAGELADAGTFTASDLLKALNRADGIEWTAAERLALPQAVSAFLTGRLGSILQAVLKDERDHQHGRHLANRLPRDKSPISRLESAEMTAASLLSMRKTLAEHQQEMLLTALDEWLSECGTTPESLMAEHTARQNRLIEMFHDLEADLDSLARLDWLTDCTTGDALHGLLMKDPGGVYPRMDAAAAARLRLQTDLLARRFHCRPMHVTREAMALAQDAEAQSLERHIGYWLLDAEGVSLLRRSLGTRHGRLSCFFLRSPDRMQRTLLWVFSVLVGFTFLQARQPLLLLPVFLIAAGTISRAALSRMQNPRPLPMMALRNASEDLRTLVVLQAPLHSGHEAVALVRHLKTAAHAFPADGVDFLLVGDPEPSETAQDPRDMDLFAAAAMAVSALNGPEYRFLYLQRGRVRTGHRRWAVPGGRAGALRTVCRLIALGDCGDQPVFATFDTALLYRRYAFVFTLTQEARPVPGMLASLLAAAAHPLATRSAIPGGWRGVSILLPRLQADPRQPGNLLHTATVRHPFSAYEGVGLIRPDAYLESTEGFLPDAPIGTDALAGALAGCITVESAVCLLDRPSTLHTLLTDAWRDTLAAWRTAPWQLPWVQTPSGFLYAPISPGDRFRLREALRRGLVPVAQALLLLFSLLTRNIPLLLLVLILPEAADTPAFGKEALLRMFSRAALLPLRAVLHASAIGTALWGLYRATPDQPPAIETLEAWAQSLAATVCAALGVAIPGMWWPGLLLGGLYAAFPLVHRLLESPIPPPEPLSDEDAAFLLNAARSSWQFFSNRVTIESGLLPPVAAPEIAVSEDGPMPLTTSPEACAAYLLACVCATELGFIPANECAERLQYALQSLRTLSMPLHLPCRTYALPGGALLEDTVDSGAVGLLVCAVMVCAQAVRTWLPDLDETHHPLAAALDEYAASIDLRRLYDHRIGLFCDGLDAGGHPGPTVPWLADVRVLLSVAGIARRDIPPAHMNRLSGTCVQGETARLPLSQHGDAAAYLLPELFLPGDPDVSAEIIRMQQLRGMEGLFGLSGSADEARGLTEVAAAPPDPRPVYSPCAAALCLPEAPGAAVRCLKEMAAHGMLGDEGFADAIDLTDPSVPVPGDRVDAFGQGMILCAIAHVLADAPVRRYFCGLPEVEATLPLLRMHRITLLPNGLVR